MRTRAALLLEGIALWGELKPLLTAEALIERALTYCDWAVAKGLLATAPMHHPRPQLVGAGGRATGSPTPVVPYIDLQLVVFPQDGIAQPGVVYRTCCALDKGGRGGWHSG